MRSTTTWRLRERERAAQHVRRDGAAGSTPTAATESGVTAATSVVHLEQLAAEHGCALRAAVRHPEFRTELMRYNATLMARRRAQAPTSSELSRLEVGLEQALRQSAKMTDTRSPSGTAGPPRRTTTRSRASRATARRASTSS